MATDEDKSKISKLLQNVDVPEVKLSERCSDLVKEFHNKFDKEVEDEETEEAPTRDLEVNPYKVDKQLIEEIDKKLQQLLSENKKAKKENTESVILAGPDPKRPWRTNSSKEKLLRIDSELKRHHEKSSDMIAPMPENEMEDLVKECRVETLVAPPVGADRLRDTVDAAMKNLPNFQYKRIVNSTATSILSEAHKIADAATAEKPVATNVAAVAGDAPTVVVTPAAVSSSGAHIPRPDTKQCFLRSLGELRNLRMLAVEYSHIADGTGGALVALLPVLKRTHFRFQLICREDQIPGRADAALGTGGYGIPDTIWKRVAIACPDLYVLMVFFRIRDYDNIRRFLTPSIPLREVHLQLGIDLKMKQRQDSDISCFVRHMAGRYADTLVTLSIHQWRFANFPLRRVFELMPRLVRFFYVGRVEDEVDLKRMLQIIACGVCDKLKQITVQIQDEECRRDYWKNVVEALTEEYTEIMEFLEVQLCLCIYKV